MLVGQDDGQLLLINIASGECVTLFEGHIDWILAIDTNWATMRAVSGGGDGAVYLWDLVSGMGCNLAATLDTRSCVRAIAVDWQPAAGNQKATSPTGRRSLFGIASASIGVSRMSTSTSLLRKGTADTNSRRSLSRRSLSASIATSGLPCRALCGSDDGRLELFDLDARQHVKTFHLQLRLISALAVDWSKLRAFVGHGDSGLDLLDLEGATTIRSFSGHTCLVNTICVNWTKGIALCGSGDSLLAVWDVRRGSQARFLRGHSGAITATEVHWSSNRALTGSADHTLRLWNLKEGSCLRVLDAHEQPIRSLSVDWEAGLAVSSAAAVGAIMLWDINEDSTEKPETLRLAALDALCTAACTSVLALQPQEGLAETSKILADT